MKLFDIKQDDNINGFGDILHSDGSKTYNTMRGLITIKRPSVVLFIEQILNEGHMGWSYAPKIEKALTDGVITQEEFSNIVRILD